MKSLAYFGKKLVHLCKFSCTKVSNFYISCKILIKSYFHILLFEVNPVWIQLSYFSTISLFGYLALKLSQPRTITPNSTSASPFTPNNIDILFTSISAATVSSMATVEMEFFSNTQLIFMTILMLMGGEVFTSLFRLNLKTFFHRNELITNTNTKELVSFSGSVGVEENEKPKENDLESNTNYYLRNFSVRSDGLNYDSVIKSLGYVVLVYFLVVQMVGVILVASYTSLVSSAREVLTKKGISIQTFSIFVTVSTFSNTGFVPTNENMIVFKKNSGLLLLLIPQTLLGNTLFAPSLRFLIWVLEKLTKREDYRYMLKNSKEMGYGHLISSVKCQFLAMTVLGFIVIQFVLLCAMEWNSQVMDGLSWFEKLVAAFFQVVNTRHSGEAVFDLSIVSSAILVLFVAMMYLPQYFSFMPIKPEEEVTKSGKGHKNEGRTAMQCILFSQLSYLVIFIVLICILEREKMKTDPLNFNVLSITLEVISAYGNVGYSTGYSCARQIKAEASCKDRWYGFVGRWSNLPKFVLIIVMLFGRLKKFTSHGGKAWRVSKYS
ncbi:sodium transporter HKT1 [Jatropha curcas]|nr:sodium transporter HKT1 [Jatropha curcas]